MELSKIIVFGIVAAIIATLLKDEKPEISMQISLVSGIIIFLFMLSRLTTVMEAMQNLAYRINLDVTYLNTVLKIIGISYLASFGIEICQDSGQRSIGSKIEFAAKVFIIVVALPVMMAVMDMIVTIMP